MSVMKDAVMFHPQRGRKYVSECHPETNNRCSAATQKQIADLKIEMVELKGIHTQITDIKTNQKSQNRRSWALIFLILTTSIGVSIKLAKLY